MTSLATVIHVNLLQLSSSRILTCLPTRLLDMLRADIGTATASWYPSPMDSNDQHDTSPTRCPVTTQGCQATRLSARAQPHTRHRQRCYDWLDHPGARHLSPKVAGPRAGKRPEAHDPSGPPCSSAAGAPLVPCRRSVMSAPNLRPRGVRPALDGEQQPRNGRCIDKPR